MNQQDPMGGAQPEPTEEELRAAMEEQMRRLRVQDVVLQTVATLVNLGGRRLGLGPETEGERDLDQARLAIDATRALAPLLGQEEQNAVKEALSQLQMAYAREAGGGAEAPRSAQPDQPDQPPVAGEDVSPQPAAQPSADDEERRRARSRIWTPGS